MGPAFDPSSSRSKSGVLRLLVALLLMIAGVIGGTMDANAAATSAQATAAALTTDEFPAVHLAGEDPAPRANRRRRLRRPLMIRVRRMLALRWVRPHDPLIRTRIPLSPPCWRGPPLSSC